MSTRNTKKPALFMHTDLGNAKYFATVHTNSLRFDHCMRRWLEWNRHKRRWVVDEEKKIVSIAGKVVERRLKEALLMPHPNDAEEEERKREIGWCVQSQNIGKLKAMIELAQSQTPIRDNGKDWDTDPWLLGVGNGVVNLKTGKLREGNFQDKITRFSPVKFNPDARCPRFDKFMLEIFNGDEQMVDWVERALGYCLTGNTNEQVVFMPYGLGANGKTTLIEMICHIMGGYATGLEPGALDRKPDHQLAEGVKLMGARFAKSVETREGRRIDEERLKAWTGGDLLTVRPLYKHPFDFSPTHKLWLSFNHKPVISDLTPAMWRRIKLIPFERNFVAQQTADPDLIETLKGEAEGILVRLIEASLAWQRRGLHDEPAKIQAATAEYEKESDPLADFVTDCCVLRGNGETHPKSLLWKRYKEWCRENGQTPIEYKSFAGVLTSKGCSEGRKPGTGARFWGGIALQPPSDEGVGGLRDGYDRHSQVL